MIDSLSDSAKKRLPVGIRKLSDRHQLIFVLLRMRRDPAYICAHLGISIDETRDSIGDIQQVLAVEGMLDLVSDPVFYPVDKPTDDDDEHAGYVQLSSNSVDVEDQIAIDMFYRSLRDSIGKLAKNDKRLLSLWFDKELTAKEILGFYQNIGQSVADKKAPDKCVEQDVFYAIEKIIRDLLTLVRNHYGDKEIFSPSALRALLNETGTRVGS